VRKNQQKTEDDERFVVVVVVVFLDTCGEQRKGAFSEDEEASTTSPLWGEK